MVACLRYVLPLLCGFAAASATGQTGLRLVMWRTADGLPQSLTLSVSVNPGGYVLTTHGPGQPAALLDGFSVTVLTNFTDAVGRVQGTPEAGLWSLTRTGLRQVTTAGETLHPVADIEAELRASPLRPLRPLSLLPLDAGRVLVLLPDRLLAYDADRRAARVVLRPDFAEAGRFNELAAAGPGAAVISAERRFVRVRWPAGETGGEGGFSFEISPPAEAAGVFDLQRPCTAADGAVVAAALRSDGEGRAVVRWSARGLEAWPVGEAARQAWPGPDGAIWYHDGGGVFRFDPQAGPAARQRQALEAGRIMDLAVEADGTFWLATTEGLMRSARALWQRPAAAPPTGEAPVLALATDREGRLALLSPDRFWWQAPAGWQSLPRDSTEEPPAAAARVLPLPGLGWLVPPGQGAESPAWQLAVTDQATWHSPPTALAGLTPAGQDAAGRLLLLGMAGPGRVARVAVYDGLVAPASEAVPEGLQEIGRPAFALGTRRGELWLGGETALLWRRGTHWSRFDTATGAGEGALAALELPDGRVWIGGRDGLREFDGTGWRPVRRGLDRVQSLALARDGAIWAATASGLHRYRDEAWTTLGSEEGLPAEVAYAVLEDQTGTLWAGTARGAAVLDRGVDRDAPRAEILGADLPAIAGDGRALFLLGGADRWHFTPSGRLQFSWRLNNGPWSPWRSATVALVTNLNAGTHVFAVRALDLAGNVSAAPAVREFTVVLPWFRDPRLLWVALLGAATAAGFAILAVNRHFRLRRSYAEVERKVRERTRDLERANAELLHSQKMRALGTLAAGVAHDFNGLLSVIRGSAQLLAPTLPPDARARSRIERILAAVEQGGGLVRAMLGFSRPGARTGETVDPAQVMREAMALLEETTARRVRLELPTGPIPPVPGSAEMLRQVLVNLLRNADEAMHQAGETTLRLEALPAPPPGCVLKPAADGPCLAIAVADTGAGISPEHLARIFEPFFTTKGFSEQRGTGLGLLMVHEFCKDLGYGLQVDSAPDRGSTFRVLLPHAAAGV